MTTDRDDIVGRLVDGRYRVESVLARGGMATVYVATDIRLDRTVAVKVMRRALAEDHDFVTRFEHEAKAAARLSHPNVVAVYDQGSYDGLVFLVMEYVPGHTLRDVIRTHGALEPARALGVIDQVLLALSAAHEAGFVHRDIKPENVLITASGMVKVADFGLARALNGDGTGTSVGTIIGTVAYLSPEQVLTGAADERSDIYSAGIVLFELLTGVVPFEAATPIAVAYRHVNEDVPAPSELVDGVPDFVDDMVLIATAREPADRYPDAWTFEQDVVDAQAMLVVDPSPAPTRSSRPASTPATTARQTSTSRPASAAAPAAAGAAAATAAAASSAAPVDEADMAESATVMVERGHMDDPTQVFTSAPTGGAATAGTSSSVTTALSRSNASMDGTAVLTRPDVPPVNHRPIVVPSARPASSGGGGRDGGPDPRIASSGRSGKRTAFLLAVVLLTVLVGGGAWYLGSLRYVEVPDVTGMSVGEASRTLAVAELSLVEAGEEPSDNVPSGSVVRTDPGVGDRARAGSSVDVITSTGPELIAVPSVTGMSVDEATTAITGAGLALGNTDNVYSADAPAGDVVGSRPEAGSTQRPGTEVTLLVSNGSEPIDIPNVVGQPLAEAKARMGDAGLVTTVREETAPAGTPSGQVTATEPAVGTTVQVGSTVTLVVSKNTGPVRVPDVVGMGQQEAVATLQGVGLLPATVNQLPIVVLDKVYAQDPPAGSSLPPGGTVTLTIV